LEKEEANIESPDGLIVFAKTATELGETSRRSILSTSTAGHFHIFIGIVQNLKKQMAFCVIWALLSLTSIVSFKYSSLSILPPSLANAKM
jgi:hypothetical protein